MVMCCTFSDITVCTLHYIPCNVKCRQPRWTIHWVVWLTITKPTELTLIPYRNFFTFPVCFPLCLIDNTTSSCWVVRVFSPIQHYLCHCNLTCKWLITCFKINVLCKTINL